MKVIACVLPLLVDGARIHRKHLQNASSVGDHHQEFQTPRCGFVPRKGDCQKQWEYLYSIGSRGSIMKKYGMECQDMQCPDRACDANCKDCRDPCVIRLFEREHGKTAFFDMDKDPALCADRAALFLEGKASGQADAEEWKVPQHSAAMWAKYADKFKQQLLDRRAMGMKVTSPLFYKDDQLKLFFDHCQDCSNPNSHRYIEIIHKSAWVSGSRPSIADFPIPRGTPIDVPLPELKDKIALIKHEAKAASSQNGDRKVWLTLECLRCDADKHVEVIKSSGAFDFDGVVTAVYSNIRWRYRTNWGYGFDHMAPRYGQTIGEALIEKCEATSTKGCCSFWNDECSDPANEWCNQSPSRCGECKGKWLGEKPKPK